MGHNQLTVIQHVMTHELVDEISRNTTESSIATFVLLELLKRLGEAVGDLNILSPDLAPTGLMRLFS